MHGRPSNVPGMPDFYTHKAAVDTESLDSKELRERNTDLVLKLGNAMMRINDLEELNADLKRTIAALCMQISQSNHHNGAEPVASPVAVAVAPKTIIEPSQFRGQMIPRVLLAIQANPDQTLSDLARQIGISAVSVSQACRKYAALLTRRLDGNAVRVSLREGE